MEGDGTGLRLFRHEGKNCYVALWGLVERPKGAAVPRMLLYFVPVKRVSINAVCPVECRKDVLDTGAFLNTASFTQKGKKVKSLLVSDGAALYARIAEEYGLLHRFCVHGQGQWNNKSRVSGHGTVQVNTGLVDERWSVIKNYVPKSLHAADGQGQMNHNLWVYVYSWWFRAHYPCHKERLSLLGSFWSDSSSD